MLIDQSIERIRAYRQVQGWSILRLAKESGMGESTIRRLDDPTWSPTADTLRKLEAVIPADFFAHTPAPAPSPPGAATSPAGSPTGALGDTDGRAA